MTRSHFSLLIFRHQLKAIIFHAIWEATKSSKSITGLLIIYLGFCVTSDHLFLFENTPAVVNVVCFFMILMFAVQYIL